MTYYPTIEEDLTRAKEMLARGISGGDIFAVYKLLESFVDQVESYQLLLATMGGTDYRAAILAWSRLASQLLHEGIEHTECQEALGRAQAHLEEDRIERSLMVKQTLDLQLRAETAERAVDQLRLQNHRLIQERALHWMRGPLVGVAEAAERFELQRSNFLRDCVGKPDFPAPVADLRCGPVWRWADLEAWRRTNNEKEK